MKYSIIIPVYNDLNLPACLESLGQLHGEIEHEVIVVENSQTDWIQPLVEQHQFTYTTEPITGSYQARNTGIGLATGDVLVFTDSDCAVAPDWLQRIDQTLADDSIAGVMGYSTGAPSTRVAALEQLMYEANIAAFTNKPALRRVDTRNLAMRRSVFERIGQFMHDLQYGGDMEFGARAHAAGLRIVYDANMLVTHHNAKRLNTLLVKRVRQSFGNMQIVQAYDRSYIEIYFPHLLRYQATTQNRWRYYVYYLLLWPQRYLADWMVRVLPLRLGYTYFKAVNVLAMRLGQLSFVLGKSTW